MITIRAVLITTAHRLVSDFGIKLVYILSLILTFSQNHENINICNIGQGKAQHRKYKRLKLGGSQAYDRSIVYTVVISLGSI
jgi:hypothetical protein